MFFRRRHTSLLLFSFVLAIWFTGRGTYAQKTTDGKLSPVSERFNNVQDRLRRTKFPLPRPTPGNFVPRRENNLPLGNGKKIGEIVIERATVSPNKPVLKTNDVKATVPPRNDKIKTKDGKTTVITHQKERNTKGKATVTPLSFVKDKATVTPRQLIPNPKVFETVRPLRPILTTA